MRKKLMLSHQVMTGAIRLNWENKGFADLRLTAGYGNLGGR